MVCYKVLYVEHFGLLQQVVLLNFTWHETEVRSYVSGCSPVLVLQCLASTDTMVEGRRDDEGFLPAVAGCRERR